MKSSRYWSNRAKERMQGYHKGSDKTIQIINQAYDKAIKDIENDVRKIFGKYTFDGELTPTEAKKYLNQKVPNFILDLIRENYPKVKNEELKRWMLNRLNAPAYSARIARLEALKESVYLRSKELADIEIQASTSQYIDTIEQAYHRNMFDIHKGLGVGFEFAAMPPNVIEGILRSPWSGKHFSQRVWNNTDVIAEKVTEIVTSGFMSGRTIDQMSRELSEFANVGKYTATRLVRTETTYMANAAEIESYKECDIEKYIYVATLDLRTSEKCQKLDRKAFEVSKAVPGENLPPMHPNCRSTTRSYISEEELVKIKRRARDPKTGKTYLVPANMNYKEWYAKYVKEKKNE